MEDRTKPYTIIVGVSATCNHPPRSAGPPGRPPCAAAGWSRSGPWRPLLPGTASRGTPAVATPDVGAAEAAERESLAADVAEVLGADHPADVRLVHGSKAEALLATAAALDADLIAIDTPPRTDLSDPAVVRGSPDRVGRRPR